MQKNSSTGPPKVAAHQVDPDAERYKVIDATGLAARQIQFLLNMYARWGYRLTANIPPDWQGGGLLILELSLDLARAKREPVDDFVYLTPKAMAALAAKGQ